MCVPWWTLSLSLDIREGRHPVIERRLPPGEPYVSNSVALDSDRRQIMMITGPNMRAASRPCCAGRP